VTDQENHAAGDPAPDAPASASAGAMLRQAREDAGLTIDAVAQQLKLAARQIRALEDGDFAVLPGRTFVRGFVRNYARLLRIDADAAVAALQGTAAAPTLEAPTLQPTSPSIGELPTHDSNRSGWTPWAIPLTLAAIVAGAAIYEFLRPGAELWRSAAPEAVAVPVVPNTTQSPPAGAADHPSGTALPNPTIEAAPASATTGALSAAASEATSAPSTAPSVAAISPAAPPAAAARAPASARPPSVATRASAAGTDSAVSAAAEPSLALTFRDYSWVEVKDRNGRVLLSRMNAGGTTESVSGPPPLDVVIGNANDVKVTYRGQPVDLAPYMRQNTARLTLP
jgi:cytoskeleton protein RodZ